MRFVMESRLTSDSITKHHLDSVQKPCHRQPYPVHDRKTMNYNLATILAVIAILFVLLTYITGAPLVPVAVILLGLAIIFGGSGVRRV
jgi:hypothetical protein